MSSQSYNDVAIRVDSNDSAALLDYLRADGGSYLVVKELEDSNPHYHVYLRTTRKLPALRTALKRAMPELTGNGSYSVAACRDVERYLRYMMKGNSAQEMAEVVGANGLQYADREWQEAQHSAYWAENEELGRRRKLATVGEAVLASCKDSNVMWSNREKIAELYIRELVSRNKAINLFSVRSNVSLIQCKLCPDDSAITDLAAHCVNY